MKRKILLFFAFLCIISLSIAIDYTWLLSNGEVLVSGGSASKSFTFPGKNEVILKIKEGILSASQDVIFYVVDRNYPYCVGGKNWIFHDESNPDVFLIPSEGDCFRENGYAGRKSCCSPGKECIVKNGLGTCSEYVNVFITSCSEYTNQNDCENDRYNIAELGISKIVGIDNFCGSVIDVSYFGELTFAHSCRCEWNTSAGEGACVSKWSTNTSNNDGVSICHGSCQVTTTKVVGNCSVDDYRIEYIDSTWISDNTDGDCKQSCNEGSSQVKIPCGGVVSLDFFNAISFFTTLILITIGYMFLIKK